MGFLEKGEFFRQSITASSVAKQQFSPLWRSLWPAQNVTYIAK